ncbi:MAG: hypothetical protein H0W59_04940 [Chloroflexia bacterium]|nr:hypothetical protein [Chloroflexia bacterium]MBA3643398.1 hypothetical protein [Chloroflexia bacterium]
MRHVPLQAITGAGLIGITWPVAWFQWEPWSLHSFFPLWLGYILLVDGLVRWRTGTSLLSRDKGRFIALFLISAPGWWLFEAANERLHNWSYQTADSLSRWEFAVRATIAFSTVVPAIFETAELFRSFSAFQRRIPIARLDPNRAGLCAIAATGVLMIVIAVTFPDWAYPLTWIGAFLALDPINRLLGARSLAGRIAANDWSEVLTLFAAGLTCGFFWEMWNSRSSPKWFYDVPHIEMPKLFEMPLLGYGGYLPFALEIFVFYQFVTWLFLRQPDRYVMPATAPASNSGSLTSRRQSGWTPISPRSYNPGGREHGD